MDYVKNDKAFVLRIAKQKLSRYYSLVERLRIFIPMTVTNEDGDEVNYSNSTPLGKTVNEIYVNSQMIAKIGYDETITAVPSDNQNYLGASCFLLTKWI